MKFISMFDLVGIFINFEDIINFLDQIIQNYRSRFRDDRPKSLLNLGIVTYLDLSVPLYIACFPTDSKVFRKSQELSSLSHS